MTKNFSERYKKHNFFMRFLLESKAGLIIIAINFLVFLYFNVFHFKYIDVGYFVLYSGNILRGYLWTIITSGFLHRDWSHLLFNMLGVLVFSRIVERQLGFVKTFQVYFGSLVFSMIFSTIGYLIMGKNVALIGASGAVMGLISIAMLLEPFSITYEMILPLPTMIKGWLFFYGDFLGFVGNKNDGISHLAHLFGFISVAFLFYFFSKKERQKIKTGLIINVVSFGILFLLRQWIYSW